MPPCQFKTRVEQAGGSPRPARVLRGYEQVNLEARFEVNHITRISMPNSSEHGVFVQIELRAKRLVKDPNLIGLQIDHHINILGGARDAM